MAIKRIFLGWTTPALPEVCRQLLERCGGSKPADLSGLVAVFPVREAGRRFLELLVEQAGGEVIPPRILSMGSLPELLYVPKHPFASDLAQRLAWMRALQELDAELLGVLVARPPDRGDLAGWLRLAELLRSAHVELSADLLTFGDVARRGGAVAGFNEVRRWTILAEVQKRYLEILDELQLWDQQTARKVAVRDRECRSDQEIVLVGTVDLNRTMRAMLEQVSDRVSVYLHAPESLSDHFDAYGCVVPEKWESQWIDFQEDQVRVVDDTAAQGFAVVEQLAGFHGRFAPDEITIAVPDPSTAPSLLQTLHQWGIPAHWGLQRKLSASPPYRLLEAIADFLENRLSDRFAALIRHPDLGERINREGFPPDWLTQWDRHYSEQLSSQLNDLLARGSGARIARSLTTLVDALLQPLARGRAPLSGWYSGVSEVLLSLYGDERVLPGNVEQQLRLEACSRILAAFSEQSGIPASLEPSVSASAAIRIVLNELSGEALPVTAAGQSLKFSGWLDLPLDDTPAVVLTSFNDGIIPASVNHDLFLPNQLRVALGLEDNSRRYARDCHALQSLLHSRKTVRLIVSRRNGRGDPQFPSRLLFAGAPEEIARRVLRFYRHDGPSGSAPFPPELQPSEKSGFSIPRPRPGLPPKQVMRVTEFRDYLASPYRYYLRHLLRLEELTDRLVELDSRLFGTLVHEVLGEFGSLPERHTTDQQDLEGMLSGLLEDISRRRYGANPLPTVKIQIQQVQQRLKSFAAWQSDWRQSGWRIEHVEWSRQEPAVFDLGDGRSIRLVGRIDRIDFHEETGRWAILDYKTGESSTDPDKSHRQRDQWTDLQLPLYRHLVGDFADGANVDLGYIVLPRNNDVTHKIANWPSELLASADDEARRIGRDILDGRFWVELDSPSRFLEEYGCICQDHVFGQELVL